MLIKKNVCVGAALVSGGKTNTDHNLHPTSYNEGGEKYVEK
jgi:hypothetical protein